MQPELKQSLEQLLKSGSATASTHHWRLRQRHERHRAPARWRRGISALRPDLVPRSRAAADRILTPRACVISRVTPRRTSTAWRWSFSPPPSRRRIRERDRGGQRRHPLRAPRRMSRRVQRMRSRHVRDRRQPRRQDDDLVDADSPCCGRQTQNRRTTSARMFRCSARTRRGLTENISWSRPTKATGRLAPFAPHASLVLNIEEGAPRLSSQHRGDRAGLRRAVRADAGPDRLLRR